VGWGGGEGGKEGVGGGWEWVRGMGGRGGVGGRGKGGGVGWGEGGEEEGGCREVVWEVGGGLEGVSN